MERCVVIGQTDENSLVLLFSLLISTIFSALLLPLLKAFTTTTVKATTQNNNNAIFNNGATPGIPVYVTNWKNQPSSKWLLLLQFSACVTCLMMPPAPSSRCRFIHPPSLPHNLLTSSFNWILGQLIMEPPMRNLMRKSAPRPSWATCTWVPTTRGRWVSALRTSPTPRLFRINLSLVIAALQRDVVGAAQPCRNAHHVSLAKTPHCISVHASPLRDRRLSRWSDDSTVSFLVSS